MTYWQDQAAKAVAAGYQPGNRWEAMRLTYLRQHQPKRVAKLEADGDLVAHVQGETWHAMRLVERLEAEGTPTQTAEELGLAQLFPERH